MPDMVGFKYGEFNALPDSTTNGTIYVAKAADGKAYMYVDKDGEKLNITSPNATFYGEAEWVDEETINVDLDGFSLEIGSQITIKMPEWYNTQHIETAVTVGVTYLTINNESKMQLAMRDNAVRPLLAHSIWTFVYDGSSWQLIGEVDTTNNGIVLFQSANPSLQGTDEATSWSNNPAPLLIGNVAATAAGQISAYFPSAKAFYAEGVTPTLASNGELHIPSGYLTLGTTGTYNYPYLNIDSDYVCNGYGPGRVSISSEYINWFDFDHYADCYLYFNDTGIALADDASYGGRFANITSDEVWFSPSISTDSSVYAGGRRLPHVYYGTTVPSSSTGQNGDVYIMYS